MPQKYFFVKKELITMQTTCTCWTNKQKENKDQTHANIELLLNDYINIHI